MFNSKRNSRGFTIIEIMIVLAIAGLILLIVFLAVPALKRNARNLQRKHDAGSIAAAVVTFMHNHDEKIPDQLKSDATSNISFDMANDSDLSDFDIVQLSYYDPSHDPNWGSDAGPDTTGYGVIISTSIVTTPQTINIIALDDNGTDINNINTETISVILGETCNNTGTGPGPLNFHSVAVFYVIETGGNGLKCVEL